MRILGLDCATNTGWSVINDDGSYNSSGTVNFKKKRGESNGIMFLKFRKWLEEKCASENIELLAYEQAHFRGGAATEIGVGLQTHAQATAEDFGIQSYPVKTNTLKLWATGKGNVGKGKMIEEAAVRTGKDITNDDEADAVLVGLKAYEDLNPVLSL